MPSVAWNEIRTWNGSQSDGFEELCCQFARSEPTPVNSKFISKGKPDSGIECFWILPNGDEWAWQAKFFIDGLDKGRWQQCDKSVLKALDGHPRLRKLFFCFPYKFPDARKPNRISGANHWENHHVKWNEWAKKRGRVIDFVLWDEHELLLRLSNPEHRGRCWFWFNTPAMDSAWFQRNIDGAVSLADERYSPNLHFELPLSVHFDALGRTSAFRATIDSYGLKLSKVLSDLSRHRSSDSDLGKATEQVCQCLDACLDMVNSLTLDTRSAIPFPQLTESLVVAQELIQTALRLVWNHLQDKANQFRKEHGRSPDAYEIHDVGFSDYRLREAATFVNEFVKFCESQDAALANQGAMLIVGEAGLGKTHLVCSIAEKRVGVGQPTIILLGQQFDESEPWNQIIRLTGLSCDRDTFLGALDASGEAAHCRALLMLDAINEGPGVRFWQNHLSAMLSHLRNYPHVGIVITIRRTYFDKTTLPTQQFVTVTHQGFMGFATAATRHFFKCYGLAEPNVPMLDPEFDSPLFLKLVCRALKSSNRQELPSDLLGVSSIFKFVLDEINSRLAKKLDYVQSDHFVDRATARVATLMVESGGEFIPLQVARQEIELIFPADGFSNSLLQHLFAEHVLVRVPGSVGSNEEYVRFAYQRLSDHMIVQSILERTPKKEVPKLFLTKGVFGKRMRKGIGFYEIAGWLEALAIQLPEKYGLEIDQLFKSSFENEVLRRAFLCSLIWRKAAYFTNGTETRVNTLLNGSHQSEVLDSLICVAARAGHPYNADWLDAKLRPLKMAERDAWWSIFIFGKIEEEGNIHRLIEWARAEREENGFHSEVVRLAALTLTWCLTTSDRFVRDRATKALVSLLEEQIPIMRWLLEHFDNVDEPYVQERLHAVGYGCAMLTKQKPELQKLAQGVYDRIFSNGTPPASVLLRDHGRGIIERAVRMGLKINYDPALIVPPYKSIWPKSPPSLAHLEKRYKHGKYDDQSRALWLICNSVTNDDFSRYVIGDVSWWSDRRRKGKECQSPKELFERLLKSVSADAAETLQYYADCMRCIHDRNPYLGDTAESSRLSQRFVDFVDANMDVVLNKSQIRHFKKYIVPHLKDPSNKHNKHVFSIELFKRLILRRVLELGWTCERFNDFDTNVRLKDRAAHKAERIGKKYQWIAYDEFHARISDNFGLAESGIPIMEDEHLQKGTWPDHFRDIDPSLLLQNSAHDGWGRNQRNWWTPHDYSAWLSAPSPLHWLKQTSDLPAPVDFLRVTDLNGRKWLVLNAYACWERKDTAGNLHGRAPDRQEVHYIFRSYLVRKKHFKTVAEWGNKQNWINDRLPSAHGFYKRYLHEHYWAEYFDCPEDSDWITRVWQVNDLPHPVLPTTAEFSCGESGYDCSVDKGFQISMPTRWIVKKMNLQISGRRGEFTDSKNNVIASDPSTRKKGHSTLLIDEPAFQKFLDREGLVLMWTLLGEKNIYPPETFSPTWLGRLTILGLYYWDGTNIVGNYRNEFFDPQRRC